MSVREGGGSRFAWIALEAALIVFGAGVAYLAAEWQQDRQEAREVVAAFEAIVDELGENRRLMADARDKHVAISQLLSPYAYGGASGDPPVYQAFQSGFYQGAQPYWTAWETAQAVGTLAHFDDLSAVLSISRRYDELESYEESSRPIGEIIYREMYDGGAGRVYENWRGMLSLIQTSLFRECELVRSIDALFVDLEIPAEDRPAEASPDSQRFCEGMLSQAGR